MKHINDNQHALTEILYKVCERGVYFSKVLVVLFIAYFD